MSEGEGITPPEVHQGGVEKKDRKQILEEALYGKSLQEIINLFANPDSEVARLFSSEEVTLYIKELQEIAQDVRLKGLFTPNIRTAFHNFPTQDELRFMIQEATAREILNKVDFGHLKTLPAIKLVIQDLFNYLHVGDQMVDEQGNYVDMKDYINTLESVISLAKSSTVPRSVIDTFTSRYGLRAAIEGALGSAKIAE